MLATAAPRPTFWRPILAVSIVLAFMVALWVPPQPASAAIQVPDVTAQGVYAFDANTGIKLFGKNENERMPIGSTVKIVTALVTMKYAELDQEVTIVEGDLVDIAVDSNMNLQTGDTLTVSQLLYGLLIPSGSDGANALARHVGQIISGSDDPIAQYDAFVGAMNSYVADLGLENSRFTNPHGLDAPNSYSSARDIAVLGSLLMKDEFLAGIVKEPGYSFVSVGPEARPYQGGSTNSLLGESGVVGVKTGSTEEAGGCVVLARQVNSGGSLVITAVLGADLAYDDAGKITTDQRWDDATQLFQYMDASFAWLPLNDSETFANLPTELQVWGVSVKGNPAIPVTTGDATQTRYQLALAPDGGGTIDIYYDQDRVGSLPLEPASAATRDGTAVGEMGMAA